MTRRKVAAVVAVVFALASIGVLKGAFFARHFVSSQLSEQKISFSPYEKDKATYDAIPSLKKYAGKPVVNGWQARQYANVIDHHVNETTGGKSYSEMSSLARANPTDTKLQDARRTALDGQLLRGTLLNVYGWWWIGTIALWAGWVFAMGALAAVVVAVLPRRH
jgi:hypothetical protein